ncbi:hypothetical protein DAEQUDRAFT_724476 [Daedalea quercina L-15889]|uniref:Uncharacterized protein n=1 Tax=Daedalea quercina L-15889 TaxID=1314783 RepID=A0A165RSN2_9APHY|nr:hypothetical protein DAEQUDRAFT_724476 [Daedalea quercina L-15889]
MAAPLTAADVYAGQLYRLGHGYPLWDPNPPKGEPFIGDVGFISQGTFHRIFNALEPKDDGANKLAPVGHKPFSFATEFSKVKTVDAITQSVLPSRTMSHFSVKARVAESSEHVGAGFRFQCAGDQGAVLFMKKSANHEYVHESRAMVEYISRNLARWHEYIRDIVDVNVPKESLRFISGFHKTADWAVASYVSTGRLAEIELNTDFGVASAAFSVASGTMVAPVLEQRWGPPPRRAAGPEDDERNQCVFINYYKLKWRLGMFPRVMKAAAGYDELPRGPYSDADGGRASTGGASDTEEMDELETDRPSFQCWDPVDFVLDYILENAANVEVAIANDRDINKLCEQRKCEIPDDIPLFLETIKPQIAVTEDGRQSYTVP